MQVKNYIVENRDLFFDYLEKELCQKGISYVRIENEIHYENKIIRLYDIELDKRMIISIMFNQIYIKQNYENELLIKCIDSGLSNIENNGYYLKDVSEITTDNYLIKQKNYQAFNKKIQKQQANIVNQKLKMYKK